MCWILGPLHQLVVLVNVTIIVHMVDIGKLCQLVMFVKLFCSRLEVLSLATRNRVLSQKSSAKNPQHNASAGSPQGILNQDFSASDA